MHGCVVAVAVAVAVARCVSPREWVCLVETRVSVACLDILCAVMFRLGASCSLPMVFTRCASPGQ